MPEEPNEGFPESPGADGAAAPDPVDAAAHAALKSERDDLYDRLLRKTAEFDNYRKRVERERRDHADQSVTDLLLELLLIVDDFELALLVETTDASYKKGIALISAKLSDLLRRQGVTPIDVAGKDFDPNIHQAVAHEESPAHRDGEIIAELRRGYRRNDRLLRPSMVKVAKA